MAAKPPPPKVVPAKPSAEIHRARKRGRTYGIVFGLAAVVAGIGWTDWWRAIPDDVQPTFVGRGKCIDCHQQEHKLWTGSHHNLAMQKATTETVLGDFNDIEFEHLGVQSRLFKRGDRFFVNTEGPGGKYDDFEVKYTFGVTPLQQYMVEFDRPEDMPDNEIARLQVLRISWDTKAKKWFHLDPPDVSDRLAPDDDLHWTGVAQRWNNMCADCHSTNLRRNYDVKSGVYHTTFTDIDVSCESCHGPGSLHVQMAETPALFKWDRKRGYGLAKLKDKEHHVEVEACASCHSRRRTLCEGYAGGMKLHDYCAPEVLSEAAYHADGQILDEVYEYGSFVQSKMYHKGITCTDCHNPHNLQLKFEGNKLCTSCHAHPAGKYDTPNHHHHKEGTAGASCVECHMPATTYMAVDPRRDHSLRIPRPDLSVQLKTPNACTSCHIKDAKLPDDVDRSGLKEYADWLRKAREGNAPIAAELARLDEWCDKAVDKWFKAQRKTDPHFASILAAARRGDASAPRKLREMLADRRIPAIARATAALELSVSLEAGNSTNDALLQATKDADPQVRAAAAMSLANLSDETALTNGLSAALSDPVKFVPIEAARGLAHLEGNNLKPADVPRRKRALDEFKDSVLVEADRAHAHLVLGSMYDAMGDLKAAEEAYRTALQVEPLVVGPRRNLAAVLDRRIDQTLQEAKEALSQGQPRDKAQIEQELAKLNGEIRQLRRDELSLLERNARLAPNLPSVQHQLGLSLYMHGRMEEAEDALRKAAELAPNDGFYNYHLAIFYRDTGKNTEALKHARRAAELRPETSAYQQLVSELERER